ncbi:hypothetical protein SO802_010511 [Lithocarpus litseifolius]|uniref:Uncharacterized protein n=1 Tax=Lithocarpus litseifolius TaxID=425828 RepID=A0AAW2DHF5_9ROSI
MYRAITVVVALIWTHLGDHDLVIAAFKFTVPILGLALPMVSVAFMAGNCLVLRDLNWLAYLVLIIAFFFLFIVWIIFLPLCLESSLPRHIIRDIFHCLFYLLIKFTIGDTDDREEE